MCVKLQEKNQKLGDYGVRSDYKRIPNLESHVTVLRQPTPGPDDFIKYIRIDPNTHHKYISKMESYLIKQFTGTTFTPDSPLDLDYQQSHITSIHSGI